MNVAVALAAAVLVTGPAHGAADAPLVLQRIEPSVDGKIVVERVAAPDATVPERWRLNLDVWVRNTSSQTYALQRAWVGYPNAPVTISEATYSGISIAPGEVRKIQLPENRDLPFPIPPQVSVTLDFGSQAIVATRLLVEHRNPVAGDAYLFPGKRHDLPDSQYWTDGQNHITGSNHRSSATQRFAYDLVVRRWDGKRWTSVRPGTSGKRNSDSLVWELPVYAMADGWILRCRRSDRDNSKPGVKSDGAGNNLRVVHAPDEVALYAHLRQDSIPKELCRREGVDASERRAVRVRAGQFLGRVGNSGRSSGPHLHVHLDTTGDKTGQGRPLQFRNIRTRFAGIDWRVAAPCSAKNKRFAVGRAAAVGYRQLIEPLWAAGASELTRAGLRETCFQDFVDGAVASGYKPAWFDGYDVGGKAFVNVVLRPGGGDWLMRHALDHATYQAEITRWHDRGYRPTLVESYRDGDRLRYAFIAEKRSARVGAYHGAEAIVHQKLANDYKAQGYVPRAVAVVSLKGKLYYTALWEKAAGSGWLLASTLTSGEYQKWVNTNLKAGRRIAYVNAYHHDGEPHFAAVAASWATTRVGRHGLDGAAFQREWLAHTGDKLRTELVTGYRQGEAHRFAALWR